MKWIRYGWPLALFLLLCFFLKTGITQHRQEKTIYAPSLQKGQQEKIIFNPRTREVTVVTGEVSGKNGAAGHALYGKPGGVQSTAWTSYAPGKVSIIEDDKGHLSVKVQKSGFCLAPGLSAGIDSASGRLRLGLDFQWYFVDRFGLVSGLSGETGSPTNPRAYLGLSYQPPIRLLANTSLLVGIDNKKAILFGVRINL